MNDSSLSVSRILRLVGALLLDAVAIILFVKTFFWFTVMMPAGESVLMLFVLLLGLAAVNVVIIAPPLRRAGIAYSTAVCTLLVLYAVVANVVSAITIWTLMLLWYAVWQLLILAVFVILFAIVLAFARRASQSAAAGDAERAARGNVALMLSDMQAALSAKTADPAFAKLTAAFSALKERIGASTPFGRIQGNPGVADLEYRIMGNLNFLLGELRGGLTAESAERLEAVMEETRRMVMNREALNIR